MKTFTESIFSYWRGYLGATEDFTFNYTSPQQLRGMEQHGKLNRTRKITWITLVIVLRFPFRIFSQNHGRVNEHSLAELG